MRPRVAAPDRPSSYILFTLRNPFRPKKLTIENKISMIMTIGCIIIYKLKFDLSLQIPVYTL